MPNLHLCDLDLNKNSLLNAVVHPVGTAPTNPVEGQIYYDTGDDTIYFRNASAWVDIGDNSGDITGVTFIADGGSNLVTSSGAVSLDIAGGTGITTAATSGTITVNVDAEQTGITSILATDLIIGEDAETAIDFGTADEIDFKINNSATLTLAAGKLYPVTGNQVDLGTSALKFKNGWFGSTVTAVAFAGPLTGNVTGNVSGTALTVTQAAQTAITSLGALTALTVDNLGVNGNTITANSGALNLTPATGSAVVLDGTISVDAGVVTGATSISSTAFVGALTGNASGSAGTVTNIGNLTGDVTSVNRATTIGASKVLHGMLNDDIISGQGALTGAIDDTDEFLVSDAGTVKKADFSVVRDAVFADVSGDGTIAAGGALVVTKADGDFTVTGNLTVSGTQTILNTATVEVEDNILQLNTTQGTPDVVTAATSGISIYRGDGVTQASLIFDDSDDTWDLTNHLTVAGTITGSLTGAVTGNADTATNLVASTSSVVALGSINMGHASDTTIARSAVGRVSIEGQQIATSKKFVLAHATTDVTGNNAGTDDTAFTILHGMGDQLEYMVQVIAASGGATVFPCVTRTNTTVVITFNAAAAQSAYTALLVRV